MPTRKPRASRRSPASPHGGFVDAADFGFSPGASGMVNAQALQAAVDGGGTITVSRPGIYRLGTTVFVGGHTALRFGHGVFLQKVDEQGPFTHVLLNKGARHRRFDEQIAIEGLQILVNGIDVRDFLVYGLHGQLAFFCVRDLRIERFRCLDLGPRQYAIQVCTFEDILIDDVVIKGGKDGVHLGRGKRFALRRGIFQTFDDAVALNAHDYATGNPELGWIEDGVVEQCHDLDAPETTGFFCRILAGGWPDWRPGMVVRQSDSVVSDGRVYRVQAKPDGTLYTSLTPPRHASGREVLDGICWGVVQDDAVHTAGVRNVVFRDIVLAKPRIGFSVHFDDDVYSRSCYPGAPVPVQRQLMLENVVVAHGRRCPLISIDTPVDVVAIASSRIGDNPIVFRGDGAVPEHGRTTVDMRGCVFGHDGPMDLLVNGIPGKEIAFRTSASIELSPGFSARVVPGPGQVQVQSDLTGLRKDGTPNSQRSTNSL